MCFCAVFSLGRDDDDVFFTIIYQVFIQIFIEEINIDSLSLELCVRLGRV